MKAKTRKAIAVAGKVLEWTVFVVLIVTFLIVLSPLLPTKKYIYTYIVATGSMEKTIQAGSVAFVKPAESNNLKKGDIITFSSPKHPNITILHRVYEVRKKNGSVSYATKGDNNNAPDNWTIEPALIKGQYLFSIPYIGHIGAFIKTQKGFALVVLLPALILALMQIRTIKQGIDEEVERRTQLALDKAKAKTGKSVLKSIILLAVILNGLVMYGAVGISKALFVSGATVSGISISVKDFVPPPVPQLKYPLDNTIRTSAGLIQTWSVVTDQHDANPVKYFYESCKVNPLNNSGNCPAGQIRHTETLTITQKRTINGESVIVKTSGNNANDGKFWWRVRAFDTSGNYSAWSEVWELTLDSTKPSKPQGLTIYKGHDTTSGNLLGCGNATSTQNVSVVWNQGTDLNIDYYWIGNETNSKAHKVMHPSVQYKDVLTSEGSHYYTVIAVDKAGNESVISDQCGLTLDTTAPTDIKLSITGSYTKAVEEKVENGTFKDGLSGWDTAGDVEITAVDTITQPSGPSLVITPSAGSAMARIGKPDYGSVDGNMVWENRLMQSFEGGAKSFSLKYNFASFDDMDDPGFFIRLNGREVYEQSSASLPVPTPGYARASGWKDFYYDLSDYDKSDDVNLAIYAGNTNAMKTQSWVYVDEITTYYVTAPGHATYTLSGTDDLSGIDHFQYRIDGGGWMSTTSTFPLIDHGSHWIEYYAVDKAGNASAIYTVHVLTDTDPPDPVTGLKIDEIKENYAVLSWKAPGNDSAVGRAAKYDIRYSLLPITTEALFNSASQVGKIPVPQSSGLTDSVEVLGLNPDTTYYFAVRAADEAPNWSTIETISGKTLPATGDAISYGDIVINELMWMGSSVSQADEWIELRNMTDRDINVKGFKIYGYEDVDPMITLPDKTIPAKGYFLITNFTPGSSQSQLKSSVVADYITEGLVLNQSALQLELTDRLDNRIDEAWDYREDLSGDEGEGLYDNALLKYYSMERASVPEDGTDPLNWYTCIDISSRTEFFTAGVMGSDVRGTPGYENRSENEPYSKRLVPSPTPTGTSTPSAKLIMSEGDDSVTIKAENIGGFAELVYLLENKATGKAIADNSASPEILTGQDVFEASGIILETCSDGVCTKMTDTENLRLEVALTDKEGKEIRIESGL